MRARHWLGFVIGLSAASCSQLAQKIEENVCGNGVIEPLHQEECDTNDASTCRPKDDPAPCTVICDPLASPSGCADGLVCGDDRRCRVPRGTFTSVQLAEGYNHVTGADLDGDGAADLVGTEGVASRYDVNLLGADRALRATIELPGTHATFAPLAFDLSGSDGLPDLVFRGGALLGVVEGSADATFPNRIITQQASLQVPPNVTPDQILDAAFLPLTFTTTDGTNTVVHFRQLETLFVAKAGPASHLVFVVGDDLNVPPVPVDLGLPPASPVEIVAVSAELYASGGGPCEQIVFGAVGGANLVVLDACQGPQPIVSKIPLGGAIAGTLLPFSLGLEGGVVVTEVEHPAEVLRAFGPSQLGLEPFGVHTPFAVGDVNGDGVLDGVDGTGIALCPIDAPGAPCATYVEAFDVGPSGAQIVDLQGDGQLDVVTVNDLEKTARIYRNQGGGFTTTTLSTDIGIDRLLVADLDGDVDADLITSIAHDGAVTLHLHVNDGQGSFLPAELIGDVPDVESWAVADVAGNDGILDVLVLGQGLPPAVSVLAGGQGGLFSPFPFGNRSHPLAIAQADVLGGDLEPESVGAADLAVLVAYEKGSKFKPMGCGPNGCLALQVVPTRVDAEGSRAPGTTAYATVLDADFEGGFASETGASPGATLVAGEHEGKPLLVAFVQRQIGGEPSPQTPADPSLFSTLVFTATGAPGEAPTALAEQPNVLVMGAAWGATKDGVGLAVLARFAVDATSEARVCFLTDPAALAALSQASCTKVSPEARALALLDVDFDGVDEIVVVGRPAVEVVRGQEVSLLEGVVGGDTVWAGDLDGDNVGDVVTSRADGVTTLHYGETKFSFE